MTITIYGLTPYRKEVRGLVRDLRCIWALEEIGAPYQHKVMDPLKREHKSPEYLRLNPFGKVPTMTDGDLVLFESSAICTYLAEKHNKLIPAFGTPQRAKYNQWMAFCISTLEPWVSRVIGFDFFTDTPNETTAALRKTAFENVESFLAVVDKELSNRDYFLVDFSVVDIVFGSAMIYLAHTDIRQKFPAIDAYLKRLYSRPAFLRADATQKFG